MNLDRMVDAHLEALRQQVGLTDELHYRHAVALTRPDRQHHVQWHHDAPQYVALWSADDGPSLLQHVPRWLVCTIDAPPRPPPGPMVFSLGG